MIQEFQYAFPQGYESIGNVLKVEYRHRSDEEILGVKTFLTDKSLVREYVQDEMKWWRGEREARGVSIEEAYKCRSCEFAERCEWRINKVEELKTGREKRTRSFV